MKGIFLGACLERHEMYDMDYNDIDPKTVIDKAEKMYI